MSSTAAPSKTEAIKASLKKAGLSQDLRSYTSVQLDRAANCGDLVGESLRRHIMGRPEEESMKPSKPRRTSAKPKGGLSARQAAAKVLKEAKKPMSAGEVADAVLKRKLAPGLNGKTPKATIGAQVYTAAKTGAFGIVKAGKGKFKYDAKKAAAMANRAAAS